LRTIVRLYDTGNDLSAAVCNFGKYGAMSKKKPCILSAMTTNVHMWHEELRLHIQTAAKSLIVILGPTASGKTDFSLDTAEAIGRAEIVNADSRQLYRGLDIGTAKIRPDDMRGIPHHLIDVLDPTEEVTVAWYKEHAERTIDEILSRKHVPILVGGSMLYISAIIDGLEPLSPVDLGIRKKLEADYDRDGGVSAYKRLQELDPDAAFAFHPNNKPYVIRALEIIESTGHRASKQKRHATSPYDLFILGLQWPRVKIVKRINERTKNLLGHYNTSINGSIEGLGWVGEVWKLMQRGVPIDVPAMKSHGYREIYEAISRKLQAVSTMTPEVLRAIAQDPKLYESIAAKTRQYAKRQVTWWKHDSRIHWIDRG